MAGPLRRARCGRTAAGGTSGALGGYIGHVTGLMQPSARHALFLFFPEPCRGWQLHLHCWPLTKRTYFPIAGATVLARFTLALDQQPSWCRRGVSTAIPCSLPSAQARLACKSVQVPFLQSIQGTATCARPHYLLKAASPCCSQLASSCHQPPGLPGDLGGLVGRGRESASACVCVLSLHPGIPSRRLLTTYLVSLVPSSRPLVGCKDTRQCVNLCRRHPVRPLSRTVYQCTSTCSPAPSNRAARPLSAGQNALANSANPSSLPGLPSLFPSKSASSFLAPVCSQSQPPTCVAPR